MSDFLGGPNQCRLCGGVEFIKLLTLTQSPQYISRLLTREMLSEDRPQPLLIFQCRQCRLVQSVSSPNSQGYEKYIFSWMHIKTMSEYRERLCARYVDEFKLIGRRVLDVGCGSGEYLELLKTNGAIVTGIEPSLPLAQRAREKGFEVIQGYVSKEVLADVSPFDGFTCLQVLEHLDDPLYFLRVLKSKLIPNAVAMIEVPSLEAILDDRRLFEFFVDHVNYFTVSTLAATCESAGLRVRSIVSGFDNQFLIAFVTPTDTVDADPFTEMQESLQQARLWVRDLAEQGLRVAAWGAGYKSTAALAELDLSCLVCVIDSDVAKHGLYTPVSHLEVVSPNILREGAIDAVLVTAVTYKREILQQIRQELRFDGLVAVLGRRLEVV